jgi:low affinity Fe/Cu permease
MPFSHPHEKRHTWFERFAETASNFTTRWLFFLIMLVGAGAWAWAAATERARLEHLIAGVFTIVALFKVSLLANAEKRHLEELRQRHDDERQLLQALLGATGRQSDGRVAEQSSRERS